MKIYKVKDTASKQRSSFKMSAKDKYNASNWTKRIFFCLQKIQLMINMTSLANKRPAIKWSANEGVFQEIFKISNRQLNQEEFIKHNQKTFGENPLDSVKLGTKKLQLLYNALKKWRGIKDIPETCSGIAPEELALFYFLLDQVLNDTNTSLEDAVCFPPTNTSHVPEKPWINTKKKTCVKTSLKKKN